jgi:hypothetical protein
MKRDGSQQPRQNSLDAHYTPPGIARQLLTHINYLPPGVIADFAVGGGELLIHATHRWRGRPIHACDISAKVVSSISKRWGDWRVGKCDFLSPRSRSASQILREVKGRVALCLANPPFSYRGAKRWRVNVADNITIECSPAIAFLLTATEYLCPEGRILAIIPANAVNSQRDEDAMAMLSRLGKLTVLDRYRRGAFPSCTSQTISVSFHLSAAESLAIPKIAERAPRLQVELTRGCIPMYRVAPLREGSIPVVHTIDLYEHGVHEPANGTPASSRIVWGPAVLIPRVGKPNKGKVALYTASRSIALSDCVFAIRCSSHSDALYLLNLLLDNWTFLRGVYHGTCAPYMTTRDLTNALVALGVQITERSGSDNSLMTSDALSAGP